MQVRDDGHPDARERRRPVRQLQPFDADLDAADTEPAEPDDLAEKLDAELCTPFPNSVARPPAWAYRSAPQLDRVQLRRGRHVPQARSKSRQATTTQAAKTATRRATSQPSAGNGKSGNGKTRAASSSAPVTTANGAGG